MGGRDAVQLGVQARTVTYGTWEGWDRGTSHVDLVFPRVRSLEGRILAWSPGTGGEPVEGGVAVMPQMGSPADWEAFLETIGGKWVMFSFPQPTCRADDQWREFAQDGSFEAMAEARAQANRAWNQNLAATGSQDGRRRDLHAQMEEAGALGIVTSLWPGSYGTTRVFNAYNRNTPTFELGCEDYGLVHRLAASAANPCFGSPRKRKTGRGAGRERHRGDSGNGASRRICHALRTLRFVGGRIGSD